MEDQILFSLYYMSSRVTFSFIVMLKGRLLAEDMV
jgi:hypothetical protein